MVFFPGLGGEGSVLYMLLSFLMLIVFFIFFPRLMLFQIQYKMRNSVEKLEENADDAEDLFLDALSDNPSSGMRNDLDPMKNMVVSPPTGIDPNGLVGKLESVLDFSEDKMTRFVHDLAEADLDEEQKANTVMGFKGVYGSQQIYVMVRHFKELIEDTKNYQLGGMMAMMLPLYEEIAESQKAATEAFVEGVPIGDSVGPMIAASFMDSDSEPEEGAEDVIYTEEEFEDDELVVLKSRGPGSRLGKYGDAIEELAEEKDLDKIIFVDAGMRFEGEETGKIVDGTGVLMGGPGVEKFKIEEVASEHDIPLEGFVVKQSGPQASRPMHSKIYDAVPDAVERVEEEVRDADGTVLLVGVGNTVGIGNDRDSLQDLPDKLEEYWEEEDEESTSYFGLMKAFPMGGGDQHGGALSLASQLHPGIPSGAAYDRFKPQNTFELFQSLVR